MNKFFLFLFLFLVINMNSYGIEIIIPSKIYINSKDEMIDVPIKIKNMDKNVTGFELDIEFDNSLLSVLEVKSGSFLSKTDNNVDFLGPIVYGNNLKFGIIITGDKTLPQGEGTIANIKFKGIKSGDTTITIKNAIFVDNSLPVKELSVDVVTSGEIGKVSSSGGGGGCSIGSNSHVYLIILLILTFTLIMKRKMKIKVYE